MEEETIVAIATPRGKGARGIVRLSGARSLEVVSRCLERPLGAGTYVRREGRLLLGGTAPFAVVVYVMRAPRSYTREDVVEIHAPGAPPLLAAILERCRRAGARLARPGEFTERAFLNGRIDLAQAEAVLAVIRATSDAEEKLALSALRGDLSREIKAVRSTLMALAVDVEAGLDFVEDEATFADSARRKEVTAASAASIAEILKHSAAATVFREEILSVLYGRVNAGKSSIFNMLAGSPEAIVEAVPGTTRDFLEAEVEIEGAHFIIVDTAGVRPPAEIVEEIAVERAHRIAAGAQVVLFVVDGSEKPDGDVAGLYENVRALPHIVLLNKADRPLAARREDWKRAFGAPEVVEISALTGQGRNELELALARTALGGAVDLSGSRFLLAQRQKECLEDALAALERATALGERAGDELVSLEIREAVQALGRVTGEDYVGDLLEEVFSRFCIGK